jgi:hypothetical protein
MLANLPAHQAAHSQAEQRTDKRGEQKGARSSLRRWRPTRRWHHLFSIPPRRKGIVSLLVALKWLPCITIILIRIQHDIQPQLFLKHLPACYQSLSSINRENECRKKRIFFS